MIETGASGAPSSVLVTHTRVFAAGRNGGNPCPVILDAEGSLPASAMQALARGFGLDTAFILPVTNEDADLRIRYFVPNHEIGVSGHATIAAVTVALLSKLLSDSPALIATSSGMFEVRWTRHSAGYRITLEQLPPVFGSILEPDRVAVVLGIETGAIASDASPVQIVSASRAKIVVPLVDSQILNELTPDFEALWRLCEESQVSGLYPFTRHTELRNVNAEARQFPVRTGFLEDPATGVAAAALGAYLTHYDLEGPTGHHEFRIAQGYAMGSPSLIEAIVNCGADGRIIRTAVRGEARVVRREQIRL